MFLPFIKQFIATVEAFEKDFYLKGDKAQENAWWLTQLTVGYNDRFLDIRACILSGSFNADANMSQLLIKLVSVFSF